MPAERNRESEGPLAVRTGNLKLTDDPVTGQVTIQMQIQPSHFEQTCMDYYI